MGLSPLECGSNREAAVSPLESRPDFGKQTASIVPKPGWFQSSKFLMFRNLLAKSSGLGGLLHSIGDGDTRYLEGYRQHVRSQS